MPAKYSTYWTLPAISQSDFPEHFPFALGSSFSTCAPGLVCPDPGKTPENIYFSPNSAFFDLAVGCVGDAPYQLARL
ncbi:MAG: hypothetical protein MUO64_21205 [Anaerolineales bacterium]|nr:hypothetical protein [Anaerolineales bacterium]